MIASLDPSFRRGDEEIRPRGKARLPEPGRLREPFSHARFLPRGQGRGGAACHLPPHILPARLARMLRKILRTMRPRQWPKNAFLFAALVFDLQLTSTVPLIRTVVGFLLLCLASGKITID